MAKKIMIVDDEANVCKTVKLILEGEGFGVVTASSGPEALKKLGEEKVDLALLDFLMPEMSGRVLAEEIRKDPELKDLKLAFITVATFGETGMDELQELDILDHILKPFDSEDLVKRVKRMVGE